MCVRLDACPSGQHVKISIKLPSQKFWMLYVEAASTLGESMCVSPLRTISQFLSHCGYPGYKPHWLSQLDVLWPCLSDEGLKSWGIRCRAQALGSSGGFEFPLDCGWQCWRLVCWDAMPGPVHPL